MEHVGHVKMPVFAGNFAVKHQVQKQVTQFLAKFWPIARVDGVGELIGFFNG